MITESTILVAVAVTTSATGIGAFVLSLLSFIRAGRAANAAIEAKIQSITNGKTLVELAVNTNSNTETIKDMATRLGDQQGYKRAETEGAIRAEALREGQSQPQTPDTTK